MSWTRLIFRDKVAVKAEYAEMAAYFKRRIGENYFKGYIDEHQTQLYCHWDIISSFRLIPPIPVFQMNFDDKKNAGGNIVVRFKLANALIILAVIGTIWYSYEMFIVKAPIVFVIGPPLIAYLIGAFVYYNAFSNLMSDLKTIEYRHKIASQELR